MKTTSIELARTLSKLGVRKVSYMKHLEGEILRELLPEFTAPPEPNMRIIAAYTLDEILEMLPANIDEKTLCGKEGTVQYVLTLTKSNSYYFSYDCLGGCEYCDPFEGERACITFANKDNPAEAAGELLVWCIENGHVKPEEL